MTKTIDIRGQKITFKSDGAFPRFYRLLNKRDIFSDMQKLNGEEAVSNGGIEVLEDVAYAMMKYADKECELTIDEWLSQFETFDLLEALPNIISMWLAEVDTQSTAKKKTD